MTKAQKKHWVNGLQIRPLIIRPGNHYSYAISIFNYGLLICSNPSIEVFKLI